MEKKVYEGLECLQLRYIPTQYGDLIPIYINPFSYEESRNLEKDSTGAY